MVVYRVILSQSPRRYNSGSVEEPGYSLRPAPHRTARLPARSPSPRLCTLTEAFTAASSSPYPRLSLGLPLRAPRAQQSLSPPQEDPIITSLELRQLHFLPSKLQVLP